ncbi:Very-long-chain (3R)-3-hydroxyacyl-CoA dehydratase [Apodemus speciosus]|uniref:Very-long-chain (3R)-3-hydroxyacyl-CoA dehydratase n=1 Tax=Apodemus speciosus TaxID=105296 RepID=A0ABQ0ENH3_APOSI
MLRPRPSRAPPEASLPGAPSQPIPAASPKVPEEQTEAHGALGAASLAAAQDSMVDTFYAIGLVMRVCQSISLLELLHIYIGIESNQLFPRFLQLTERVVILFGVITSQEEVQEKYIVCVLFIFWNLLDMVRYTYSMLSVIGTSYAVLTWLSQTLWMPIYPLCVLAEAFTIYQSLPYFESFGTNSTMLPFDISTYFPYVLKLYLMMLFIDKLKDPKPMVCISPTTIFIQKEKTSSEFFLSNRRTCEVVCRTGEKMDWWIKLQQIQHWTPAREKEHRTGQNSTMALCSKATML